MNKLTVSALTVLVAAIGFSVPAMAQSADNSNSDSFSEQEVLQELGLRGVDAVSAVEWTDKIRAEVLLADGSTVVQYFDPDSYSPVGQPSANTRVLTELDTGAGAPAELNLKSLSDGPNIDY